MSWTQDETQALDYPGMELNEFVGSTLQRTPYVLPFPPISSHEDGAVVRSSRARGAAPCRSTSSGALLLYPCHVHGARSAFVVRSSSDWRSPVWIWAFAHVLSVALVSIAAPVVWVFFFVVVDEPKVSGESNPRPGGSGA